MRLNNMFLENELEDLQKQIDELLQFVNVAQVTISHLIQDGDITVYGMESVAELNKQAEELLQKYDTLNN